MLTVAKYDNTEGCVGDLAYYLFAGQPAPLRVSADGIELKMVAHVSDEAGAHQAISADLASMAYEGWEPRRTQQANAEYLVPELRCIIHCQNRYG